MSTAVSESMLTALAMHYRLATLEQLKKAGSNLDALKEAGTLGEREIAFLERKASATPTTVDGEDFLAVAQELGHVTAVTAGKYASTLRAPMPDRDYEAACSLFNHGALQLWQVIDVLEALGRPLQYSAGAKVAYYPAKVEELDAGANCPTTGQPLGALTGLPDLGLEASSLPELERLMIMKLDSRLMKGRKTANLVIVLAHHYRLLSPEQAELLADSGWSTVQEAVQQMFEEGFLTTSGFRFLLARAEEVIEAKGVGTVGTDTSRPLLELAMSSGYVTADTLDSFLEEWQIAPDATVDPRQMDMAVIALLFNRGYIEQYQAIDLLEKRGILLDHSPIGGYQVLATGDKPGLCPGSKVKMIRLTGWSSKKALKKQLPEIERLVVHDMAAPALAAVPMAEEEGDFTLDGSRILSVTAAVAVAEEAAPDDAKLDALIERYHIMDEEQRKEAAKIVSQTQRPLFDILKEYGFIRRTAQRFIRRRFGMASNEYPPEAGLLELGVHFGYVSEKSLTGEKMDTYQELRLLGRAFNKGQFEFYQLMDLLETKEVWLDHSPKAQMQLYFAPGTADPTNLPKIPSKLGQMIPLSRPGLAKEGRLPLPTRIKIAQLKKEKPEEADVAKDDAGELGSEPLGVQLALRYNLMPRRELDRAVDAWNKTGNQTDLAHYLFESGKLTTRAMEFLLYKEEQFGGGEVHVGEMHDERLEAIAIAKHYIKEKRLAKIFGQPGAPNRDSGDDLAIGCYLHAKGALTFYQLIDLFEEKGYFLLTTPDRKRQYHMVGSIDPTADYACPDTKRLLLPLTSAPGFAPRLERLPSLKSLHIQRRSASDFTVLREGQGAVNPEVAAQAIEEARPKTAEELLSMGDIDLDSSMFGISVPQLVEVRTEARPAPEAAPKAKADGAKAENKADTTGIKSSQPEGFKPSWKERQAAKRDALRKAEKQSNKTIQRSRDALQAFYDKEMPQRKMKTRAIQKPQQVASIGSLVERRDGQDMHRAKKKAQAKAEEMVTEGVGRAIKSIMAFGTVCVVVIIVAFIMVARDSQIRRERLAKETAAAKVPAAEQQRSDVLSKARAEKNTPVVAYGQVNGASINRASKTFLLAIDFGVEVKVAWSQSASQSAFTNLEAMVKKGGPVLVRLDGKLSLDRDGTVFILADKMKKERALPAERIR